MTAASPNVISIIGGTSFVGSCLLNRLSSNSNTIIKLLLHKRDINSTLDNVHAIKGDLLDIESLTDLISPDCTVINLAYIRDKSIEVNLQGIKNLAIVCAEKKIKRLIHVSTAVVAGRSPDDVITEKTECRPISEYEHTKLAIEEFLLKEWSDVFQIAILRPTVVFGPDGRNLLKIGQECCNGSQVINYIRACVFRNRRMNLVCLHNVAAAVEFLAKSKREFKGDIFIISDDESDVNNYNYLRELFLKSSGEKDYCIPIVPIPSIIVKLLLILARKSNINLNRVYDCNKLATIGFSKPVSFPEELDKYVKWYKAITL